MEANKIAITDEALRRGAEEGMDGFLKVFIDKYLEVTGGVVNAETMPLLNCTKPPSFISSRKK